MKTIDIEQVVNYSHDQLMVTDGNGDLLLVNHAVCKNFGLRKEELLGKNVRDLVKKKYYSNSTTLKAIQSKISVTEVVVMQNGARVLSTSLPIIDPNGRVELVITNTRESDIITKFYEDIEKLEKRSLHYKNAASYLSKNMKIDIVSESPEMKTVLKNSDKVANTDSTVMLVGESGVGKEVIARYIHSRSNRRNEPFIPINCAAVPQELFESEFFGYSAGAFTGAQSKGKPGLFEMANRGTIFLDEIAEMSVNMQSKFLRVVETGEVQRVGGTAIEKSNVRIIAATNKNLEEMVKNHTFREDLYYRLMVMPIYISPLRERPEDIIGLSKNFLTALNKKYALDKILAENTIATLTRYPWKGNARELRNVIERAVILSSTDDIGAELESLIHIQAPSYEGQEDALYGIGGKTLKEATDEFREKYIEAVLQKCGGRVNEAAKILDIHRSTLYRKTKE